MSFWIGILVFVLGVWAGIGIMALLSAAKTREKEEGFYEQGGNNINNKKK